MYGYNGRMSKINKKLLQQHIHALDVEVSANRLSARDRSSFVCRSLQSLHREHNVIPPAVYFKSAFESVTRFNSGDELKSLLDAGRKTSIPNSDGVDAVLTACKQEIQKATVARTKNAVEGLVVATGGHMYALYEKELMLESLNQGQMSATRLNGLSVDSSISSIQNIEYLTEERLGINIESVSNRAIANTLQNFNKYNSLRSYQMQRNQFKALMKKVLDRSFPTASKHSSLNAFDNLNEVTSKNLCRNMVGSILTSNISRESKVKHLYKHNVANIQHYSALGIEEFSRNSLSVQESIEKSFVQISRNGNTDEIVINLSNLVSQISGSNKLTTATQSADWIKDLMSKVMKSFDPKEDYSKAIVLFRTIRSLSISLGYNEHLFVPDLVDCLRKWRFEHKMNMQSAAHDDAHIRKIVAEMYDRVPHENEEIKQKVLGGLVKLHCSYDNDDSVKPIINLVDNFYGHHKRVESAILLELLSFSIRLTNLGFKNSLYYKVKWWSKGHQIFSNFDFDSFGTERLSNSLGLISLIRKSRLSGQKLSYSSFETVLNYVANMKSSDPLFAAVIKNPRNACEMVLQEMIMNNLKVNGAIIFKTMKIFTLACSHDQMDTKSKKVILDDMLEFLNQWSTFVDPLHAENMQKSAAIVREIVKCFCLCKDPDAALEFIMTLEEENNQLDCTVYEPLIFYKGVIRGDFVGSKDLALQIISKGKKLTPVIVDSLIRSCLKRGDMVDAIDYIQDLFNQHRISPRRELFQEIIDTVKKSNNSHEMQRILHLGMYIFPNVNFEMK